MQRTCRCRNCGKDGFLPVVYAEEAYSREHCPACDSDRVEWGNACPLCGRYADVDYCDDCKQNLESSMRELLRANFTPEEIKALNTVYDGKEIE